MVSNVSTEESLASLFHVLGQALRIQILLVIGQGPACVCHLEAYLGQRQALISQHLMVLREAGLVETQREGRNIYYRLARPELLGLIYSAAELTGIEPEQIGQTVDRTLSACPCPHCNPDKDGIDCSIDLKSERPD
jgi:DNA-binding transcriptional ArsR family regulator